MQTLGLLVDKNLEEESVQGKVKVQILVKVPLLVPLQSKAKAAANIWPERH